MCACIADVVSLVDFAFCMLQCLLFISLLWYTNLYICTNTRVRVAYINACDMFFYGTVVQLNSLIVLSFDVVLPFKCRRIVVFAVESLHIAYCCYA